jgi:hypothetical protein
VRAATTARSPLVREAKATPGGERILEPLAGRRKLLENVARRTAPVACVPVSGMIS